jgi:3-deoxy-D-manno-octulosonic-acid transferase
MSWVANIAYLLGAVIYLPILLYEMVVLGKNRRGWGEKLFGPRRLETDARRCIWLHGVSLGEINAARGVVAGLEKRYPQCRMVISATTDTGFARAVQLFGEGRVFRYPLDFTWTVRRALQRIDPVALVLVEQEVWFNLATMATRRGIPVCVINGRLTERSSRRLRRLGGIARRMFGALTWVGVQDEPTAARFAGVGAMRDRIAVTGSLKWDTALVADRIEGQDALAMALGLDLQAPLWVCGSTGPGEESQVLDAFAKLREQYPNLQLALVPRKPERFNEVAQLIRSAGYRCVRRSEHPDRSGPDDAIERIGGEAGQPVVILGDTMGELRKFYALARVIFVGRSLVSMGGSDPMEAAGLGKPVVTGPHMENFAQPVAALRAAGGLFVEADASAVAERVGQLLADPDGSTEAGMAGRQAVRANQGATERTLAGLSVVIEARLAITH